MKTLFLHGAKDLRFADTPLPKPGDGEALVRVTAVSLCGSDLHWYADGMVGSYRMTEPIILGHEFAGSVESGSFSGQRVAVDPAIPCRACEFCESGLQHICQKVRFPGGSDLGALTEYVVWPEKNLKPLPGELSDIDGAMLEPLGVALHALDLHPVRPGDTVGIYGCGPIGLLLVQLARLSGASRIFATDRLTHRLEAARSFGATDTFLAGEDESKAVLFATNQRGVDTAFEAAGDPAAVITAIRTCKPGATAVLVGISQGDEITIPASMARSKELTIKIAHRMNLVYPRAITLALRGQVDLRSIVSHQYPFHEASEAFALAERREGLKVVIQVRER